MKSEDPRRGMVPPPCRAAEMAPIYVLLASNESSYLTGMVYGATGGELMP